MIEDVIEAAQRGIKGEVIERPLVDRPGRLSKLGKIMSLGKGRYFLIGGLPGSGKTSFCDSELVLKPVNDFLINGGPTPYYIYRAMERPLLEKKAKWLAWKIYDDTGQIYDVPTILGYQNKKRDLNSEDIAFFQTYSDYFKDVYRYVDIVPGATSPREILMYAFRRAYQMGKYVYTKEASVFVNDKNVGGFEGKEERQGVLRYYKDFNFGRIWEGEHRYFNDHKQVMVIHVTDHVGKLTEDGKGEMALINEHGANMGNYLRDIMEWTVVDVMQFNREMHDLNRQLKTKLKVTEADFRMSSVPFQNADMVLGLLNPYKMQKTRHHDYEIDRMVSSSGENRFRGIDVVKNSYGIDDVSFGVMLVGENGYTKFLPKAEDLRGIDYEDIAKATY